MAHESRIEAVVDSLARWAMDFRSHEHHDTDLVAHVADVPITVGLLRRAFERRFGLPFDSGLGQGRAVPATGPDERQPAGWRFQRTAGGVVARLPVVAQPTAPANRASDLAGESRHAHA